MKKILAIILLVALVGCSPQYRLKRLLKHHPELMQNDTIIYRDTFIIAQTNFDTIFKTNFDTINITRDNLQIKLIKHDSLIYLYSITPGDTIFIEKSIPVQKIIYPPTEKKTNVWFIVALCSIGFIVLIVVLNVIRLK